MEHSPLTRLPRELRDQILITTLAQAEGVSFDYPRTCRLATEQTISTLQSLDLACKQICHEARPSFLVANDINAELPVSQANKSEREREQTRRSRTKYLERLLVACRRIPEHVRAPGARLVLRLFVHISRDELPTAGQSHRHGWDDRGAFRGNGSW